MNIERSATSILGVEYSLPETVSTYESMEQRFGADSMRKVLSGAGIRNRRVAEPGVCGSDYAFTAAERLLERMAVNRAEIDLLIHCTQTPDYFLPTTACVLHERLKLEKNCACFDINLGCSQYVYALAVAHSMIVSGVARRALVLTGDTLSRTLHPQDRAVVPLLADGGSATLVGPVASREGFVAFKLGTDGSGHRHLMIPAGAFRIPASAETAVEKIDSEGNVRSANNLFMNGTAVFHFAISVVPPTVTEILSANGLKIEDVDLFLFHQANQFMLDYLFKKLRILPEKTHVYLEDVGNTSGTTVPVVLSEAMKAGKVRPGGLVLLMAFGVGFSWGATLIRWPGGAATTT